MTYGREKRPFKKRPRPPSSRDRRTNINIKKDNIKFLESETGPPSPSAEESFLWNSWKFMRTCIPDERAGDVEFRVHEVIFFLRNLITCASRCVILISASVGFLGLYPLNTDSSLWRLKRTNSIWHSRKIRRVWSAVRILYSLTNRFDRWRLPGDLWNFVADPHTARYREKSNYGKGDSGEWRINYAITQCPH